MTDWISEEVKRNAEIEARRVAHEKQEANTRELRRVEAEQAEMEAYLRRRGEAYVDSAGATPPRSVLEQWQKEYVDEKVAGEQSEREGRIEAAKGQIF